MTQGEEPGNWKKIMSFSSDDFCGDFGLDNFDSFSDSDAGYFDEPLEFDHAPKTAKAAKPAAKKAKAPATAKPLPAPVLLTPVIEAAPAPVLAAPEVHTDVMSFDADFSFSFTPAAAPEFCDDDGLEILMNPQVPCAAAIRARRKMVEAVNHGQMALFA